MLAVGDCIDLSDDMEAIADALVARGWVRKSIANAEESVLVGLRVEVTA